MVPIEVSFQFMKHVNKIILFILNVSNFFWKINAELFETEYQHDNIKTRVFRLDGNC